MSNARKIVEKSAVAECFAKLMMFWNFSKAFAKCIEAMRGTRGKRTKKQGEIEK